MSETRFSFEHQGRTVLPGQVLHVAPEKWSQAGVKGKVERYYGDSVMLRSENGAVPTVSLQYLSWDPYPETLAREDLNAAGFNNPTDRDVAVWLAARRSLPGAVLAEKEDVAADVSKIQAKKAHGCA